MNLGRYSVARRSDCHLMAGSFRWHEPALCIPHIDPQIMAMQIIASSNYYPPSIPALVFAVILALLTLAVIGLVRQVSYSFTRFLAARKLAQWMTIGRLSQDLGQGCLPKRTFDHRQGVVHATVKRTKANSVSL